MIIDGLKRFLIEYYSKEEANISPIKRYEETHLRSIIHLKNKIVVIEENDGEFNLEIVDNSGNSWKTLEYSTLKNKDALFEEISNVLEENKKMTTRQKVAFNQNLVYTFLSKNQNKVISYSDIGKQFNFEYNEVARFVSNLKKSGRIIQNKNHRTNSYTVVEG